MSIDRQRVRQYLKCFDFDALFREELGWDTVDRVTIPVAVNNRTCTLTAIAQKHGFIAYHCQPDDGQGIPERQVCNKIDRQVTDYTREHIIIYTDEAQQEQYWQWVRREKGKPVAPRGERYRVSQDGERLIQKLDALFIAWEEEDSLTLSDVKKRAKQAFDVEKVTKKFYAEFKSQHGKFLDFIKGIQDQFDKEWYASLMLNRLMFIYFIQQKGFLDGNTEYLQERLRWCQANRGEDEFQSFYRFFLLKLFHDGLGSPDRDAELNALLGKVPYLNGGIFEVHQLEDTHPDIQIPDSAFEGIFAFFDQWDWHLDDRPDKSDKEINPDVLGYIFEKYINQKQMGAYYTKEDITEYISKNTIIPYLFDAAEKGCKIAFEPGSSVWRLLQENPDRYLYDAVKKGVINDNHNVILLPDDIAAGVADVSQRGGWNRLAPESYGLPTEIWREHVARRQRCLEVREKLRSGEIHNINDLITYTLDIRQFAQDVIDTCEGPELLRAIYKAITTVSVLDPTCGSGAFLFAALNILQPLYEACLERMQGFVDDLDCAEEKPHPEKFKDFRTTLEQVAKHPNRNYFIFKSIILSNLYGVDIMEEATEICKLRLFLKLVSQVEVDPTAANMGLEPLPDIDFNIRHGNTLVGFATYEDVKEAVEGKSQGKIDLFGDMQRISEKAEIVDCAFQRFREMQTIHDMKAEDFRQEKEKLRGRLHDLNNELDKYLAEIYELGLSKKKERFQEWKKSHTPFHWFVEFYKILQAGGFDVIIGNPPYLEKSKLNGLYEPQQFTTIKARDIYAWVVERSLHLEGDITRLGLIIPVSISSSGSFDSLRSVAFRGSPVTWMSHFANRPGQLFEGAQNRLTIYLRLGKNKESHNTYSSRYYRWDARGGERKNIFNNISYTSVQKILNEFHNLVPKTGSERLNAIIKKIRADNLLKDQLKTNSRFPVYWVRVPGYFCQFFLEPPKAISESTGKAKIRGEVNKIFLDSEIQRRPIHALLNSSTYYVFFCTYTDCRHINSSDIKDFPLLKWKDFDKDLVDKLCSLSSELELIMNSSKSLHRKSGLLIESVDSRATKHVLDKIDEFLAQHYEFLPEELDFIINYDIKYRMGLKLLK